MKEAPHRTVFPSFKKDYPPFPSPVCVSLCTLVSVVPAEARRGHLIPQN